MSHGLHGVGHCYSFIKGYIKARSAGLHCTLYRLFSNMPKVLAQNPLSSSAEQCRYSVL